MLLIFVRLFETKNVNKNTLLIFVYIFCKGQVCILIFLSGFCSAVLGAAIHQKETKDNVKRQHKS
jgi:hypothetical protein